MNQSETTHAGIETTIAQVEKLYSTLTGGPAPSSETPYAPIPAEKDPMQHVEEQMSRLLEALGTARPERAAAPAWMPPLAVWESDSEIVVCLDLPGLKREQVEVVVQGDMLTVSGVRQVREGHRLRTSECPLGAFRRALIIPAALRGAEPVAQMKEGVLEIRVARPAAEAARSRSVPVH
jgi:HSP20 family protein